MLDNVEGWNSYSWYDHVYFSTDTTLDAQDTRIVAVRRDNLGLTVGESYTRTERVRLPQVPAGNYYLIVVADAAGQLYEHNEANNQRVQAIAVGLDTDGSQPVRVLSSAGIPSFTGLDFAPDGGRLGAAGQDRAFIWRAETGELQTTLVGHVGPVDTVDLAPDNEHVLTAGRDGTLRIWKAATGQQVGELVVPPNQPSPAAYSADGGWIIGGAGNEARLWDATTSTQLRVFSGHSGLVQAVALSSDSSRALTGSADKTAILWNATTGARLFTLAGHTQPVTAVAFSPTAAQALTASGDGTVQLWNTTTGTRTGLLLQGTPVVAAAYSRDGKYIVAAGGTPGVVYLWEVATQTLIRQFSPEDADNQAVNGVALSPDRTLMATSHTDGRVRLWRSGLAAIALQTATPLAVGSDAPVTLESYGLAYFAIDAQAGQNLLLTLAPATTSAAKVRDGTAGLTANKLHSAALDPAQVRILVKRGGFPSVSDFDYAAQGPADRLGIELPIAPTGADRYYVLLLAPALPSGPLNARLRAEYVTFHISEVSPNQASNAGETALKIRGTSLSAAMTARLIGSDGYTIVGQAPVVVSAAEVFVTFDLRGAATGRYDVQIDKPDAASVVLRGAFEVTSGIGGRLLASLVAPAALRPLRDYSFTIEYGNDGDADLPAPLLVVSSPQNALLRLSTSEPFTPGPLMVLGVATDGPAGVLRPGSRYSVRVFFRAPNADEVRFDVERLRPTAERIEWDQLAPQMRPTGLGAEAWNAIWPNFKARMGATTADMLRVLSEDAAYLAQYGNLTYDARLLLGFEMAKARGLLTAQPVLASALDAYSAASGLPLSFGRSLSSSLDLRFRLGPLGRGWVHPYEIALTHPDAGTVIVMAAGGGGHYFTNAGGGWQASPGDYTTLESQADGGFVVRGKDGAAQRFNATGQLVSVEEPNGNRITLTYTTGRLTRIEHSNGQALTLDYYPSGRISRLTDDAGRVTQYEYDASSEHLLRVVAPGNRSTQYAYITATGSAADHALTSITNPDGVHQFFTYDSRGRVASRALDNNVGLVRFGYAEPGTVTTRDAADAVSTTLFGVFGQTLRLVDAVGRTVQFQYDAALNVTRAVQPDGGATRLEYDSRGNPVRVIDALGHSLNLGYTHDSSLDWVADARGQRTDFSYDLKGNLTDITYADGSTRAYAYNALGDLTSARNGRQQTVQYGVDGLGRLTQLRYPDGRTVDYTYDARGNLLSAVDSVSGAITMQYDARDFLTRMEYPGGRWFTFEYSATGRITRRVGHDGYGLSYSYDAVGRLQRVNDGAGAQIVAYQYDTVGRLARETRGNGTYVTYEYDAVGQIIHLVNYGADGAVQSRFDYTYDSNGRPVSVATLEGTTGYAYDAVGRLTSETDPDGRHVVYTYDAVGNRVAVTENGVVTTYTANTVNRYTQMGATSFAYDADGNRIAETNALGTTQYGYDAGGRLVTVTSPSGSTSYQYNAFGQPSRTTTAGATTDYVYEPGSNLLPATEYRGGAISARNITALGLTARADAAGAMSYYAFERSGSTRQVTNASGAVVDTYDYDAFGAVRQRQESQPQPFQFRAREGARTEAAGLVIFIGGPYCPLPGDNVTRMDTIPPRVPPRFVAQPPTASEPAPWRCDRPGVSVCDTFTAIGTVGGAASGLTGIEKVIKAASVKQSLLAGLKKHSLYSGLAITVTTAWLSGGWRGDDAAQLWAEVGGNAIASLMADLAATLLVAAFLSGGGVGTVLAAFAIYFAASLIASALGPHIGHLLEKVGHFLARILRPRDPNDKVGPPGVGDRRLIPPREKLPYRINFENMRTATAPVLEVVVVDYLDTDLDWATLEFTDMAYGDRTIAVPPGHQQFAARDFPTANNIAGTTQGQMAIDLSASLNVQTGRVEWRLKAIDTATEQPPDDPLAGFLPPEDGTGRGQGYVSFTIRPRADVTDETLISNKASIIFDVNAAIETPEWLNTIDAAKPDSYVLPLPAQQATATFGVQWTGTDAGAGVLDYSIYVAEDGGPFVPWLTNTTAVSATYTGAPGKTYRFYSLARDQVGNVEDAPTVADATTSTPSAPPRERPSHDLDGDGRADLLWRNTASGQNAAWLMDGANPRAYPWLPTVAEAAWQVAGLGDLNGDGKMDLVWRNSASGQTVGWLMDGGTPTSYGWLPTVADANWKPMGVGDLDGDGKADLVWRNLSTGQNIGWLMDDCTVISYGWLPDVTDTAWKVVGLGDLDGDRKADIVWRDTTTGQNAVWLMEGTTTRSYAWLPTVSDSNWQLVNLGDLNSDGKTDLVWRNAASGENIAWLMDGATLAGYGWLPTVADPAWQLVDLGDLNGDGKGDLVWRNFTSGQNVAWLMDGVNLASYGWLPTVADFTWQPVSASRLISAVNGPPALGKTKDSGRAGMAEALAAVQAGKRAGGAPFWTGVPKDAAPMWTERGSKQGQGEVAPWAAPAQGTTVPWTAPPPTTEPVGAPRR